MRQRRRQKSAPAFNDFPVVGLGASAGGLEAFSKFFSRMPDNTGMAFVLVQHLDPKHASRLPELVRRYTKMAVHEVQDKTKVDSLVRRSFQLGLAK